MVFCPLACWEEAIQGHGNVQMQSLTLWNAQTCSKCLLDEAVGKLKLFPHLTDEMMLECHFQSNISGDVVSEEHPAIRRNHVTDKCRDTQHLQAIRWQCINAGRYRIGDVRGQL